MPMYDLRCNFCGQVHKDALQPITAVQPNCHLCVGGVMERVWLPGNANNVIGDECDVELKHGLCNPDGTPRRYTSKEDIRRAAKAKGMENYVVHQPERGSDKSKHTTRWI